MHDQSRRAVLSRSAGPHHDGAGAGRRRRRAFARTRGPGPPAAAGRTRVLADGGRSRRRASTFSDVHGELRPEFARALPGEGDTLSRHRRLAGPPPAQPARPDGPRQLPLPPAGRRAACWFGGGADLTPYYLVPRGRRPLPPHLASAARATTTASTRASSAGATTTSSCRTATSRAASAASSSTTWARGPRRPRQAPAAPPSPREADPEAMFAFVRDVGDAFLAAYLPIVERRRADAVGRARAALADCCAAAATSSSTCSTTAAPCSASRPTGASSRS